MKTPITDTDQLKGQTILNVETLENRLVIVTFTSFAVFRIERGSDYGDEELELENGESWAKGPDASATFTEKLVDLQIITPEERDLQIREREIIRERQREGSRRRAAEQERAEYARLKAKFEPEGGK